MVKPRRGCGWGRWVRILRDGDGRPRWWPGCTANYRRVPCRGRGRSLCWRHNDVVRGGRCVAILVVMGRAGWVRGWWRILQIACIKRRNKIKWIYLRQASDNICNNCWSLRCRRHRSFPSWKLWPNLSLFCLVISIHGSGHGGARYFWVEAEAVKGIDGLLIPINMRMNEWTININWGWHCCFFKLIRWGRLSPTQSNLPTRLNTTKSLTCWTAFAPCIAPPSRISLLSCEVCMYFLRNYAWGRKIVAEFKKERSHFSAMFCSLALFSAFYPNLYIFCVLKKSQCFPPFLSSSSHKRGWEQWSKKL